MIELIKILVCGDRNWNDHLAIKNGLWQTWNKCLDELMNLPSNSIGVISEQYLASSSKFPIIIEGEAKGADTQAREVAWNSFRWPVIGLRAEWWAWGNSAGPVRNREMLDLKPSVVLAFHDSIVASKGTKDCINEAIQRKIPVYLYTHQEGLNRTYFVG